MNDYSLIVQVIGLWTGFLFFLYVVICKPLIKWRKQRIRKEDDKKTYNFEKEQLCAVCKGTGLTDERWDGKCVGCFGEGIE